MRHQAAAEKALTRMAIPVLPPTAAPVPELDTRRGPGAKPYFNASPGGGGPKSNRESGGGTSSLRGRCFPRLCGHPPGSPRYYRPHPLPLGYFTPVRFVFPFPARPLLSARLAPPLCRCSSLTLPALPRRPQSALPPAEEAEAARPAGAGIRRRHPVPER